MSAEAGIEMEGADPYAFLNPDDPTDSNDMERLVEPGDQEMGDAPGSDVSGEMVDMLALMDTLQSLGVNVIDANRFVASVIRPQPTLMEMYGRGNIVAMANDSARDVSVLGDMAFDVRTTKPSGEPWDFTRKG